MAWWNETRVTITGFGLQSGTDRTLYARWSWSRAETDHFHVKWTYKTDDGVEFVGEESDTHDYTSIYTAPANAASASFAVIPVAILKETGADYGVYAWGGDWTGLQTYHFGYEPPTASNAPTISMKGYKLTVSVSDLGHKISDVNFEVWQDNREVFQTIFCFGIKTTTAKSTITVAAGHEYSARVRMRTDVSEWGEWSSFTDSEESPPEAVEDITSVKALSETSVRVEWTGTRTAENYEIEYTDDIEYFDSSSEPKSLTVESGVTHAEVTGLESGKEWFFRVRATNDGGESGWSPIRSVKIGTTPSVPSTWSSTTTASVGDTCTLFWAHNSEDGSEQTSAELELTTNGFGRSMIFNVGSPNLEKNNGKYSLDTSSYTEGTKILWRVRTKGVMDAYSEWSIQRTIEVYAPPTLSFSIVDSQEETVYELHSLPFTAVAEAWPTTQVPTSYAVSIISKTAYDAVDTLGDVRPVSVDEEIWSKIVNTNTRQFRLTVSANDIGLQNNARYAVRCSVSMNSGLTAESQWEFTVNWETEAFHPNAEVGYDPSSYSAIIRPYCYTGGISLSKGVTLSVYRREFDGTFTEIATGLDNTEGTYVTDPHPALDYARYRITATDVHTGLVNYFDTPAYPIRESSIVIQWNERWRSFDTLGSDPLADPNRSGSTVVLKGNIDISDKHDADVSLIEYIGRSHPVSYYGTQVGFTTTWNVDVDKRDKETIFALQRLAVWMGDAYVREPSGSGYWAHVSVSFSKKHLETVIPVTLDITRVSGGM